MGKKKAKKSQKDKQKLKSGNTSTLTEEKLEREPKIEEEIDGDDDLFITNIDATHVANYIRTTNKSFNSLGNIVVEQFAGRCALGIGCALVSLYEDCYPDRDDLIRRLNIIYIMFRLPEIELELRVKIVKQSDIYNHMFAPFLFHVEESEAKIEASLARIILANGISAVQNLTVTDYIHKWEGLLDNAPRLDPNGYERFESENNMHWPKHMDEYMPISFLMRKADHDRKDYESGCQEAFYPLFHIPPTNLPKRLDVQPEEIRDEFSRDMLLENQTRIAEDLEAEDEIDNGVRQKLADTFANYKDDIIKYERKVQSEVPNIIVPLPTMNRLAASAKFTASTLAKTATMSASIASGAASVKLSAVSASSSSSAPTTSTGQSSSSESQVDIRTIVLCSDRMIDAHPLNPVHTKTMCQFLSECDMKDSLFVRLHHASRLDTMLKTFINTNSKVASELMSRIYHREGIFCLRRYVEVLQLMPVGVQQMEAILKLAMTLRARPQTHIEEERVHLYTYIRYALNDCDQSGNHRNIRLISNLITKLLKDGVIHHRELFNDIRPFALKFSTSRDATLLFALVVELCSKDSASTSVDQPGPSSSR